MGYDAIVALFVASILLPLILYLAYMFMRYATEEMDHELKQVRYEAGNPPSGDAHKPVLYQYFGYILLFISLDPVFMLLFILPTIAESWNKAVLLSLAIVLIILPPLAYAVKYARRMEYWRL